MAARVPIIPRAVERTPAISVDDPQTDRAISAVRATVDRVAASRSRDVVTFDLVIGTNKVRHGLGRAVLGYSITATVASAAFAHAINTANPRSDLEVWVDVIGADQPGARVEVF